MLAKIVIALLRFSSRRTKARPLLPTIVQSVCVVELTRLGDVVSMLPATRLFRHHFPHARIHILVDQRFVSLLQGLDIDIEGHGVSSLSPVMSLIKAVFQIRALQVDLICSMSPSGRNSLISLASAAPFKVGYLTHANSLTPYLVTNPIESFGFALSVRMGYGRENIEERSLKICEALGIDQTSRDSQMAIRREIDERYRAGLRRRGVVTDREYVVIHPFSGWEYRNWNIDRFASLVRSIISGMSYDVVVLCASDEVERLNVFQKRFENITSVRFFGSRDLMETAVLIQGARLFVGNDSGPLHLAAALGVKVVGLFGPVEPALTAPRTNAGTFLYKRVDCSPCDQKACIRPDDSCMGLITHEEVFSAVAKYVRKTRIESVVADE